MKKSFVKSLGAYALAAGAAAVATNATTSQAAPVLFTCAEWYDADSDWNQDLVSFKMDGTVYENTADLYLPDGNPKDDDTFTFQELDFYWWGSEEKDATCLNIGADCGYVASPGDVWGVGRLGSGFVVGPTLADGRVWSDHATTSTGGLGGWYFYFAGEWPFGGGGYIGLYCDEPDGRHYGWANIYMSAYYAVQLNSFAFSDVPGQAVWGGGGEAFLVPGDTNNDGSINELDIDRMADAIRNGSTFFEMYDISADGTTGGQDGVIDTLDLDYLIRFLVETAIGNGTEYGDFNLDGKVDVTDLTRLSTDYGTGDTWAKGNANRYIDLLTDTTDLTILATYYGTGPADPDAVPEPMTLGLLAMGASGLLARRRR